MARGKLYNRDGFSFTEEAVAASKRMGRPIGRIVQDLRRRGFSHAEAFTLMVRDVNFHVTMEYSLKGLGRVHRRKGKR